MITRGSSGWLALVMLLLACAGLAWVIEQQLGIGPPQPVTASGGTSVPLAELPAVQSYTMPPADSYSAILERPLFSPNRRAPAEGAVSIETTAPELDITLVGVIISAEEQIAIVKQKTAAALLRLSVGDTFQGWSLSSIEPERVTFRRGEIEEHLELTFEEPPPVRKPKRKSRRKRKGRTEGQEQSETKTPAQDQDSQR